MPILNTIMGSPILSKIGSTENGTVHGGDFLAAINNRLYLCNALKHKYRTYSTNQQKTRNYAERTEQQQVHHSREPRSEVSQICR